MSDPVTLTTTPQGLVRLACGDAGVNVTPRTAEALADVFAALGAPHAGRAVSAIELDGDAVSGPMRLEVPAGERHALAAQLRFQARTARGTATRLQRVE